jgi:hypothetical protein
MIACSRQMEERSLRVSSTNTAYYPRQTAKPLLFAPIILFLLIAGACAQKLPITVISGATLIDGSGALPVPDAVVILKGDKIAAVGTSSSGRFNKPVRPAFCSCSAQIVVLME